MTNFFVQTPNSFENRVSTEVCGNGADVIETRSGSYERGWFNTIYNSFSINLTNFFVIQSLKTLFAKHTHDVFCHQKFPPKPPQALQKIKKKKKKPEM